MKIGSIFDQTSTTEFVAMLDQQYDSEQLLFSYIELAPDGGSPDYRSERIIARITNVHKENPLLSRDQAGVSASIGLESLGFNFSRRFTYGWATCSVIGALNSQGRLDMNRRGVAPNAEVHTPSQETLRQLFFDAAPSSTPIGWIETFRGTNAEEVPVTLDADQLVTKHFCVFGMTGSGKTTTAAKLLEELMARGHRMIIFDSHDDYQGLEAFTRLYADPANPQIPSEHVAAVQEAINNLNPRPTQSGGRLLELCVYERILRAASVVLYNTPAHLIARRERNIPRLTRNLVSQLIRQRPWRSLISNPQMESMRAFPELRYYGDGFQDFTIGLLAAFQGEGFSSAQYRGLSRNINQQGTGITYLQNLYRAVNNDPNITVDSTRDALRQMLNRIQGIYGDASSAGATPLNLEQFFREVASFDEQQPEIVYRLSLSDLPSNLRKAMVYAVVTYFFRSFKFGNYRARPRNGQDRNASPILFVLEEARSLIPKSSGMDDADEAGKRARNAMRELAYEGRKFSLGFGIISQKPSTIDPEVVSQANTFILHQLKSPDDQDYVRSVTETMSREELDMIKSLGTGRAIIAGVGVKSPVLVRVYSRYSEEGIAEPRPISDALQNVNQIRQNLQSLDSNE